jgi:hypothetical protein
MTCRRTSNGSKRRFIRSPRTARKREGKSWSTPFAASARIWRLLDLPLDALGAVEEVVEIDPDLTEQRARVSAKRKALGGGFDPAKGFL